MFDNDRVQQPQYPEPATPPPGFWQAMGSVIAAAFGVQSSRNRERDFKQGKFAHFAVAGAAFTLVFLLALYGIVRIVLAG